MQSPQTPATPVMQAMPATDDGRWAGLLRIERRGALALVGIDRAAKRNALSDPLVEALGDAFAGFGADVRAIVLHGLGEHFCAGLDLSELRTRTSAEGMMHSMMWHRAFDAVQFGRAPVVSALKGAVIGGGLELACATHVRVAEPSTFYALPEGQRGLFVGGGGAVRLPRLIGVARMTDMMLTGRVHDAASGQAIGLSQYLVGEGEALDRAIELAQRIADNAPLTNFAVMHALPRIADQAASEGMLTESLMAAITSGDAEAQRRMQAFLEKRATRVAPGA